MGSAGLGVLNVCLFAKFAVHRVALRDTSCLHKPREVPTGRRCASRSSRHNEHDDLGMRRALSPRPQQRPEVMSKAEVEKFAALMRAHDRGEPGSDRALLDFLSLYSQSIVSALRFYAADK